MHDLGIASLWRMSCNDEFKSQRKKANVSAANRVDGSRDHLCPCGRIFRRRGDLNYQTQPLLYQCY